MVSLLTAPVHLVTPCKVRTNLFTAGSKIIVKTEIPPDSRNEAVLSPEYYDWWYTQILTPISSNKLTSSNLHMSLLEHFSVFWELSRTPILSFVLFHRFSFIWVWNLVSYGERVSRIARSAKYLDSREMIWEGTEGDDVSKSCMISRKPTTSQPTR